MGIPEADRRVRPLFSILLPSRNRLDLLKRALGSVLRQDFAEFEVVVSDNCSEENYADYFRTLHDPRVKLVRTQAPAPVTDNWNHALAHASGQFIIMLGDDDALAPGALSRLSLLIKEHDAPEVIYAMAYHYAYADVIPHAPGGYFATVKPRPIFSDQPQAALLDVAQARRFGKSALHFRHLFGFNSQFFIWKREFIEGLGKYGPFFQSPYPDFYSSFVTMLKADRILVEPEPMAIIGISPKSFGYYFHQEQIPAGNEMLRLSGEVDPQLRSLVKGTDSALDLPGSPHYRNWLVAALCVVRNLGSEMELTIDLRRFRRMQVFEAAFQSFYKRPGSRRLAEDFVETLSGVEHRLYMRLSWTFAMLGRAKDLTPLHMHDALFALFRIYPGAAVTYHPLGKHSSISDAVDWLERIEKKKTHPAARLVAGLKHIRSWTWHHEPGTKVSTRDWAYRQMDRLHTVLGLAGSIGRRATDGTPKES